MPNQLAYVRSIAMTIVLSSTIASQLRGQSAPTSESSGGHAGTRITQSDSRPCNVEPTCRISDYCFRAGDFTATIIQMSDGASGNYRRIRLNVQFQNMTDHDLRLAYHSGASILTDDLGNTYSCCKAGGGPDTSAKGIGTNQEGKTDPQFKIEAHGLDSAVFEVWGIRNGKEAPESYHYDLTIDEMDFKNPKVIMRQRALLFRDFNAKTKFVSE